MSKRKKVTMKKVPRTSSGTLILKALLKNDKMKSVELRQIAFDNRSGLSCYTKGNKYYKPHNVKKVPQGWWCVGISDLRYGGMMEQDENGLYSITELGRLNIDKPFTKNPTMTSEMYKAEIKRLIERGNKLCSDYNSLSWKKSELESNNRELMEKNEKLLHENDILKSQLDEYHKTEEIGFLLGLDENDEDSYGQDVIKRIVGRLKK